MPENGKVLTFENDVFEGLLPPTEKLYDADPYLVNFTARVLKCSASVNPKTGDHCFAVVLDRTMFFPESGGQTCDRGTLVVGKLDTPADYHDIEEVVDDDEFPPVSVQHVAIDEATGLISHYSDVSFDPGVIVSGHLDFDHRFSNMQQHTGEHIFSGLVSSRFGLNNIGFHLSDDVVTMDYDGELSREDIRALEDAANEAIWENVPVRAFYPSPTDLAMIDYRSKKELSGDIRIVEIEGYDICACCAPHVKHTGEIGILKVLSKESMHGGTRLSILCGKRALDAFRTAHETVTGLSVLLSVPHDKIKKAVQKLYEENDQRIYDMVGLQKELLSSQLSSVPADAENVILFTKADDNISIRNAVNDLTKTHSGFVMLLSGSEHSYRFILGSKTLDCGHAAETLRNALSAKCGGSSRMVQGTIEAGKKHIKEVFSSL